MEEGKNGEWGLEVEKKCVLARVESFIRASGKSAEKCRNPSAFPGIHMKNNSLKDFFFS